MEKTQKFSKTRTEGPLLREEKHYKELYPGLESYELLPVISCKAKKFEQLEFDPNNARINDAEYILKYGAPALKQTIFNNKIIVEPLGPQLKKTSAKPCKTTVHQLGGDFKVSKKYYKYGYKAFTSSKVSKPIDRLYAKKTDHLVKSENDFFSEVSSHLNDFKVEYDMDEQDELYMQYINETRLKGNRRRLDHEIFEIVMSVLELEWFCLEKIIPHRASSNAHSSTYESQVALAQYEKYGSDDGYGYGHDQSCAICGGTDSDNSNAIIFCDGCDIAVHQECYGIVFIPEGQWLCRRCMISKHSKIKCLFCPSQTGAFKQTDTGSWSHVICGIWIKELFFANLHYMEPIEGIDLVPKSRWRLNCYICRQKTGACIQCANKNCFTAFHVTCAKRAGLFMDFGGCTILEAASNNFRSGTRLESYCNKHSPTGWGDCQLGIMRARAYFQDMEKMKHQETQEEMHKLQAPDKKNRWKTKRGTPIAPHLFFEIVQAILKILGVDDTYKISTDICKYWSMKRELKRGAPLVRKFDPILFNTLKTTELEDRIQFGEILLKDLEKLEELSNLVVKRQDSALKKETADNTINQIWHHPVRYILQNHLSSIWETKEFQLLKSADSEFVQLLRKIDNDEYKSIQSFESEIKRIFDRISNNPNLLQKIRTALTIFKRLFNKRFKNIAELDIRKMLSRDFIFKDEELHEVLWSGPIFMKEEGLSDVEPEDLNPAQERMLKAFLR